MSDTDMTGYFREMQERADRYRNFDRALYAPFKTGGGWDYNAYMLDVAYADHDEASGPFTRDEASQVFAERVARESAAGAGGALLVRLLSLGFTEDAVLHARDLGVFDFGCNTLLASCLNMNGGSMTAGCGNQLSDNKESRWINPAPHDAADWPTAYRRREGRGGVFASLTITNDESLAAKRVWSDASDR